MFFLYYFYIYFLHFFFLNNKQDMKRKSISAPFTFRAPPPFTLNHPCSGPLLTYRYHSVINPENAKGAVDTARSKEEENREMCTDIFQRSERKKTFPFPPLPQFIILYVQRIRSKFSLWRMVGMKLLDRVDLTNAAPGKIFSASIITPRAGEGAGGESQKRWFNIQEVFEAAMAYHYRPIFHTSRHCFYVFRRGHSFLSWSWVQTFPLPRTPARSKFGFFFQPRRTWPFRMNEWILEHRNDAIKDHGVCLRSVYEFEICLMMIHLVHTEGAPRDSKLQYR